jgi:hypothetical protein
LDVMSGGTYSPRSSCAHRGWGHADQTKSANAFLTGVRSHDAQAEAASQERSEGDGWPCAEEEQLGA